jgi:hypothetical protein
LFNAERKNLIANAYGTRAWRGFKYTAAIAASCPR